MEGAGTELAAVLGADQYTASITIRLRKLDTLIGSGQHLAARQSLCQWQTPRHDLPGILGTVFDDVRK